MKKFLFILSCLILTFTGCGPGTVEITTESPNIGNSDISIGVFGSWTPELLDYVTPKLSYTDKDGEHQVAIDDKEMKEKDGKISLSKEFKSKFSEKVTINLIYDRTQNNLEEEMRYDFYDDFSLTSIFYTFGNKTMSCTIVNVTINWIVSLFPNIKIDKTLSAEQAAEYLNKICDTPKTIVLEIKEDGSLYIDGKKH